MPRKKASVEIAKGELIPAAVATMRATKRNLIKLQEKVFLDNAEASLREGFAMLRRQIRAGNMKAVEMAFELNSMIKSRGGGFTLNQQIVQNNANRAEASASSNSSFDALVRKLDARGEGNNNVIEVSAST